MGGRETRRGLNKKGGMTMADNRMYLRCKVCGEAFLLAKSLSESYFSGGCSSCENRFELVHECPDGLPESRWGPELSPKEFIK